MTYRLGEAHEAIERNGVRGEVDRLSVRNTEGVGFERQTSDGDVVRDDVARDVSGTVRDLERLVRVGERRGGVGTEELVVALETKEEWSKNDIQETGFLIRTQSPPASDTQVSEPTQKSAEPESMRILNSVLAEPI